MSAALRPAGEGYAFEVDGHEWRIRPALPGGWELRAPNGSAVGWFDTPDDCVDHARGVR